MRYFSFLLLFLCCACAAPEFTMVKVNTFEEEKKISVFASAVEINSTVERFDRLPHIEDEMPITPEESLKKWIQNRFVAIKPETQLKMRVVIEKAYLTQMDEQSGHWYVFDNVKYTLSYALKFIFEKGEDVVYTHNIGGYETSSLPKRSSISVKEKVFEKMLNAMIYKIDEEIRKSVPKKFIEGN